MAMESVLVVLGTSDTDIFEMPADMSGVAVVALGNANASARTVTIKIYKQALASTETLINALSLSANAAPTKLPPISMEAGDKIIGSASNTASVLATGFVNTSGSTSSKAFQGYSAYSGAVTYPLNAIVTSSGIVYLSLQAGNLNNTPASSPSWWMEILDPADISGALLAANNLSDVASAATAFGNIKQAASESATGVLEIATQAEAEALTDDARAMTPLKTNQQFRAQTEVAMLAVSDETTDLSTGTAKITFRAPYALENITFRANVNEAPTGSTIVVDINKNGSTMMTTNKLTIDASEETSVSAATAVGMTTTTCSDDDEFTVDVDQVGSTTAGKGLKITMYGNKV